ncbi:sorting nexin-5-like [Silurus meridionalis]|nr:sorting nexin-5-like [Silurus meridionalis]
MQREQWEREEEEQMKRPVGPIHYENIRDQEDQRKKQRETLDMLRDQVRYSRLSLVHHLSGEGGAQWLRVRVTDRMGSSLNIAKLPLLGPCARPLDFCAPGTAEQRTKREHLKEKRKSVLEARLAKIRMRKMKKSKMEPGAEENEEEAPVKEDQDVPEDVIETPPPAEAAVKKVEVEIQERKDSRPGAPHVREWDRGKEFSWGQWTTRRRDERDSEFAPPSSYYGDERPTNYGRPTQEGGRGKGKPGFKRSEDESAAKVNANSIVIADVTQDGDTLTFAVTSQKLSSRNGICVFRTYDDFEWLQQSLFSQDDVEGLYGVIVRDIIYYLICTLGMVRFTDSHRCNGIKVYDVMHQFKQVCIRYESAFVSRCITESHKEYRLTWQRALEFYLQQVAAHSILGKSKLLHSFLSSTESSSKQRSKKGIFDRLSHAMEEMRKEGHKDVDEFFHNERENNMHLTALFKATTERNLDNVSENDVCTLGLGLDFESRYQEAKKEMLFRRTCKLVELENIIKTAEKAKSNKKAIMDGVQKVTQKEFNLISSVAKEEIDWYHKTRVSVLRGFLTHWCEKQLDTAKESAALFSQLLEAWKGFPL